MDFILASLIWGRCWALLLSLFLEWFLCEYLHVYSFLSNIPFWKAFWNLVEGSLFWAHVLDRWCPGPGLLDALFKAANWCMNFPTVIGDSDPVCLFFFRRSLDRHCRFVDFPFIWVLPFDLCSVVLWSRSLFFLCYGFRVCGHHFKPALRESRVKETKWFSLVDWFLFQLAFNSTLGFPGEGPMWSMASFNVGSLQKHLDCLDLQHDVIALQECRITSANLREVKFHAAEQHKDIHPGPLMRKVQSGFPEWGGVAIASTAGTSIPFHPNDDVTGHYHTLLASNRFCASWVAASNSRTVLVISLYLLSGALIDPAKFTANDQLLRVALEFASQFGNIPVCIAGDFQCPPHSYTSISAVMGKGLIFDPLLTCADREYDREDTFCRTRKWHDQDAPKSSLDGILVNQTAMEFVHSCHIIKDVGFQHARVVLEFNFPTQKRMCWTWQPHASMDLSKLVSMEDRDAIAHQLWNDKYKQECLEASESEHLHRLANQFAIDILTKAGAKWNAGKKCRGCMPSFQYADVDKHSNPSFDASSKPVADLNKLLRRINDLTFKIAKVDPSPHVLRICDTLWKKIQVGVKKFLKLTPPVNPSHDFLIETWDAVSTHRDSVARKLRFDRYQKWKSKVQASAASNCRDIYAYLKLKHDTVAPANVTDENGKPIFQVSDVLGLATKSWNDVFGCHDRDFSIAPLQNAIEGFVQPKASCVFQDLTAHQLFQVAQHRDSKAAGGFDGWRSCEIKSLPLLAFEPWQILWNHIEIDGWSLPDIFHTARLVMIPKAEAKSFAPIHRRLISLLSIPYLLYSKARFLDTLEWQSFTFPKSMCGGIQNRKTSDVSHHLAIQSERAILSNNAVCGIQIDRSKCFDRIIPRVIAFLGTKLGLDQRFFNVWIQVYQGFRRYITLSNVVTAEPLSDANGIAQGDTGSVLAINIMMACWSQLMAQFETIQSWVYIDDAYLLCHAQHLEQLKLAMDCTAMYDILCGQTTNLAKSNGWATSKQSKASLRAVFPELQIVDWFKVLGAQIKTNSKRKVLEVSTKSHSIRTLIQDIGSLPVSFRAKVTLLGAKAIPKLTFQSELNRWPNKTIENLTSCVVSALWGNRPIWRSQDLLFALATNPCRTQPACAVAASAIANIITRCATDSTFFDIWCEVVAFNKTVPYGIVDALLKAFSVVGLEFVPPASLRWLDFPVQAFVDFTPKSIRRLLRVSSMQHLYMNACKSARNDLVWGGSSGVLDPDLSPLGPRSVKPWFTDSFKCDETILVGPLTGACPTADRLYKSELASTSSCRFCNGCKETIHHLVECDVVAGKLGILPCPIDGQPHWKSHGICEVPQFLVSAMQNQMFPPEPSDNFWQQPSELWIDGSVFNGDHLFSKTLGAAVISAEGHSLYSGGWRTMWGSSFQAEVVALRVAITICTGLVFIHTDCQSLLQVWNTIQQLGYVPPNVACREEWLKITENVGIGYPSRLVLSWIRAHQADHRGPCSWAQHLNRIADNVAKKAASDVLPVGIGYATSLKWHLHLRRRWLVALSTLLQNTPVQTDQVLEQQQVAPSNEILGENRIPFSDNDDLINRFTKWDWHLPHSLFDWKMSQQRLSVPKDWKYSCDLWNISVGFLQSLEWRSHPEAGLSCYELAALFWVRTATCPPAISCGQGRFIAVPNWIRHVARCLKKTKINFFPPAVEWQARKCLYLSHTFPYGRWMGGRIWMSRDESLRIARFVSSLPNGGKKAADWDLPLVSFP